MILYCTFQDKLKTNEKSDAENDHATKLKESETDKSEENSENAPLTEKKTDDSNQLSFGNLIAKQKKAGWTCDTCMVQNESSSEKCTCCETPNPSNSKPKEIIAEKVRLAFNAVVILFYTCIYLARFTNGHRRLWQFHGATEKSFSRKMDM